MEYLPLCPKCGGEPTYMGVLGSSVWWRCRDCGWGYRTIVEPNDMPMLLREQAE